jgi:hypothetical protein
LIFAGVPLGPRRSSDTLVEYPFFEGCSLPIHGRSMLRCSVYHVDVKGKDKPIAFARLVLEQGQCCDGSAIWHPQHRPEIFVVPQFEHVVFRPYVSRQLLRFKPRVRRIRDRGGNEVEVECVKLRFDLQGDDGSQIALNGDVCFSEHIVEELIAAYVPDDSADPGRLASYWGCGIISLDLLARNNFGQPMHNRAKGWAVIKQKDISKVRERRPK